MKTGRRNSEQHGWGICSLHPDGRVGWLIDNERKVRVFPSEEDAKRAFIKIKRESHYEWSLPTEIRWFDGFGKKEQGGK